MSGTNISKNLLLRVTGFIPKIGAECRLKEKALYFPDQKKKPYQNPTARWVFQCFQGVTVIYLEDQSPMVVNWKERQQVIIDCLGEKIIGKFILKTGAEDQIFKYGLFYMKKIFTMGK